MQKILIWCRFYFLQFKVFLKMKINEIIFLLTLAWFAILYFADLAREAKAAVTAAVLTAGSRPPSKRLKRSSFFPRHSWRNTKKIEFIEMRSIFCAIIISLEESWNAACLITGVYDSLLFILVIVAPPWTFHSHINSLPKSGLFNHT